MGLDKFQIIFDTQPAVFYSGQTMSGRIVVFNSNEDKFRGINVKIYGESSVKWRSSLRRSSDKRDGFLNNLDMLLSNKHNRSRYTLHETNEVYLDHEFPIFGGEGEKLSLEPGEHSYPFTYTLPKKLPSSFEGELGFVRYTFKATVDRPWKTDCAAKVAFTVISPIDLNKDPNMASPTSVESIQKFGCCYCCCASGAVKVFVSVLTGGVVSGDTLLATVDIENTSRVALSRVTLKFIKVATYKVKRSRGKKWNCSRKCEVTIVEKNLGRLESGQAHVYQREALKIPPLPPSNLAHCNTIDLDYFVVAHISPFGAHRNFEVRVPMVVGTIPLQQNSAQYAPAPQNPPLGWNVDPSAPPPEHSMPSIYPDLPHPSFEQSAFGTTNFFDNSEKKNVFGDKNFAPMYPVFNTNNMI
ncbi:arrestin domain-containing protein 17-like [Neocloeon triangulifer]|uniref:arrestin domain-containing protein 17-like n=1 Tax=Neocloeon triangulifer TaxID=2078957 RepID=UPI00286EF73D|nr:arrestin domain-containing protein 17-like [Neocloeon triangulifer]XP_059473740.1 arrestin domain-containing protein 17-like [Neocloeon triangulifer]